MLKNKLNSYSFLWGVSFISTLIIAYFFGHNDIIVCQLINIEFTDTYTQLKNLVAKEKYGNLINNTYFDFLFITAYTLLFFFSLKVFNYTLNLRLKPKIYLVAIIPGIFDIIENIIFFKLITPNNNVNQDLFYNIYYLSVRFKWFLVLFFALIVITILLYYLIFLLNKLLDYFFK